MKLVMAALYIQNYTKMDGISDIIKSFAVKKKFKSKKDSLVFHKSFSL